MLRIDCDCIHGMCSLWVIHMKQDKELKYNASGYYDPTAFEALTNVQKGQELMDILKGDIYFYSRTTKDDIPVVIVSNNIGNKFSDYVNVVYMTKKVRNPMPTHVQIVCQGITTALCEQIHCIRKGDLHSFVRSCTEEEMDKLDAALMLSCGIKGEDNEVVYALQHRNDFLEAKNKEHEQHIFALKEELAKAKDIIETVPLADTITTAPETDSIRVTAERDLYKKLYEELLHKVMDQKVG